MKRANKILEKVQTLEGLSYGMTTLLWDVDNSQLEYREKFHSIVELAETIYHKALEVKADITKYALQEDKIFVGKYMGQ